MKIGTFGYTGKARITFDQMTNALVKENAVFVDVRASARSMAPRWNKGQLVKHFGALYVPVPEFGNLNYKTGGPIELKNYEAGLAKIEQLEKDGVSAVVLLCGCENDAGCHRMDVLRQLIEDGHKRFDFSVSENGIDQKSFFGAVI